MADAYGQSPSLPGTHPGTSFLSLVFLTEARPWQAAASRHEITGSLLRPPAANPKEANATKRVSEINAKKPYGRMPAGFIVSAKNENANLPINVCSYLQPLNRSRGIIILLLRVLSFSTEEPAGLAIIRVWSAHKNLSREYFRPIPYSSRDSLLLNRGALRCNEKKKKK